MSPRFVTYQSTVKEKDSTQQDGALIFWLLPIVFAVDTQVHCAHSHLPSHTYSSSQQIPALHGTANRILFTNCMMMTAQQRQTAKQMSPCYFTFYHRLSISFSVSLSLYAIYHWLCLFLLFGQQKTMLPGNNSTRGMVQCVYISCHFKRYKRRG